LKNLAVEKLRLLGWRFLPAIPPKLFFLLGFLLPFGGVIWV
jgi:hypothetical protein